MKILSKVMKHVWKVSSVNENKSAFYFQTRTLLFIQSKNRKTTYLGSVPTGKYMFKVLNKRSIFKC